MSSKAFSAGRLRASMLTFALGKAISAPLSIALILMLAAVMSRSEYASYIASVAVLEIGLVLGTLGIEWLIQTTVPAVMVRGNRAQLTHVVLLFALLPVVPYILIAGTLWQFAPELSAALGGVASVEVLRIYSVVLVIEGATRMLRDQLMAALLLQSFVQLSQVLRVLVVFSLVVASILSGHGVDAVDVAQAELTAAATALCVALLGLLRHLIMTWPTHRMSADLDEWLGWRSARLAGHAYGSLVLMVLIGTEVMTTLVARYLGADATAAFGFVTRLVETARRYLPADMFYGVLRPAAIGRYEDAGRKLPVLVVDTNRIIEANLLVIGVGLAVALAVGDSLVTVLSKGSVSTPVLLLASLLPILACHSVRRGVEMIAYATGHSGLFLRAAFASLLAPLLGAVLLGFTGMVQMAPLAVVIADTMFVTLAALALARKGIGAQLNFERWGRLLVAVAVAGAAGAAVAYLLAGAVGMWLGLIVAVAVYLGGIAFMNVISAEDRQWALGLFRSRANA